MRRRSVAIAARGFAWLFACTIALGTPEASVLCESSDGHVAVERAHVQGVCIEEAVRHAASSDALSGAQPPHCEDTLLDRSLVRQGDSPDGKRVPILSSVGCAAAPAVSETSRVWGGEQRGEERFRLRHGRLQRTVKLQL
jgi:hypothetical protein